MYKSLISVGGLTLLSRAAGFVRDVLLGAILGAGLVADAFVVAQRLPNHFRTIFGEGAFNSAYVPSYAQVLESETSGNEPDLRLSKALALTLAKLARADAALAVLSRAATAAPSDSEIPLLSGDVALQAHLPDAARKVRKLPALVNAVRQRLLRVGCLAEVKCKRRSRSVRVIRNRDGHAVGRHGLPRCRPE